MKKFLLIILFFLLSCSKNDDDLIDIDAFIKQGKKINIINEKSLNESNVNVLKKIFTKNYTIYNNWTQSHQNLNNLIKPTKVKISKKKQTISLKFNNFIIYKNKIFAINKKSNLQVFDLEMRKINSKKIYNRKIVKNNNLKFTMVAYNDKLFISDNLGNIKSFDINNLNLIWEKKLSVPFKSNIKIYKNNLFIINSNSKLFSINILNGKLNWSYETSSSDIKSDQSYQIAIFKDNLIFTNDSLEIYCLDLVNKNIKWSFVFRHQNFLNNPIIFKASPITIDINGNLYVSTNSGSTYSIDVNKGFVNWSAPIALIKRFAITEKYLLNVYKDRLIIFDKKNGKILLNKKILLSEKNLTFEEILINTKNILIFDTNGYLISFDKKNLNEYNVRKISKSYINYAILRDNIYINSSNSIDKY